MTSFSCSKTSISEEKTFLLKTVFSQFLLCLTSSNSTSQNMGGNGCMGRQTFLEGGPSPQPLKSPPVTPSRALLMSNLSFEGLEAGTRSRQIDISLVDYRKFQTSDGCSDLLNIDLILDSTSVELMSCALTPARYSFTFRLAVKCISFIQSQAWGLRRIGLLQ